MPDQKWLADIAYLPIREGCLQHEPQGRLLEQCPMESWFHTLKTELVSHRDCQTRIQAKADIFEYIDVFCNRSRRHSGLGYMIPAQHETIKRAA